MSHPRDTGLRKATALLEALQAKMGPAQAHLDGLLAVVRQHRHDPTRTREVAEALDEIARDRLHRLRGHRTFHAFVAAELGISRSTAHRWRERARGAKPKSPVKSGPRAKRASAPRAALTEAHALAARLRRRGLANVRVEVYVHDGEPMLRIELAVAQARELA